MKADPRHPVIYPVDRVIGSMNYELSGLEQLVSYRADLEQLVNSSCSEGCGKSACRAETMTGGEFFGNPVPPALLVVAAKFIRQTVLELTVLTLVSLVRHILKEEEEMSE